MMEQIRNKFKQMTDIKLLLLDSNTWNHLTLCESEWLIVNQIIQVRPKNLGILIRANRWAKVYF